MSQTFRPLLRHWISRLVVPLALVVWAGYLAVYRLFGGTAILLFYAAVMTVFSRPFIWQIELRLDSQGLSGRFGKKTVRVLWNDVLAARQIKQAEINFLELSSEKGSVAIPLQFFDSRIVWGHVQRYVPPEALEDDAYKRSPEYKVWLAKAESLLNDVQEPLCAGYLNWRSFIGIIGLVGVGALLVFGLSPYTLFYLVPLLLIIGKMAALLVLYRIEMTSETVTILDLWKRQVMRWDEVEYIEHIYSWGRFVMVGHDKRLAVVGPQYLAGRDQVEMLNMLRAQIKLRHIELRHRERALFTWSRNVAVGRSA